MEMRKLTSVCELSWEVVQGVEHGSGYPVEGATLGPDVGAETDEKADEDRVDDDVEVEADDKEGTKLEVDSEELLKNVYSA